MGEVLHCPLLLLPIPSPEMMRCINLVKETHGSAHEYECMITVVKFIPEVAAGLEDCKKICETPFAMNVEALRL